jgi:hypothetical protein
MTIVAIDRKPLFSFLFQTQPPFRDHTMTMSRAATDTMNTSNNRTTRRNYNDAKELSAVKKRILRFMKGLPAEKRNKLVARLADEKNAEKQYRQEQQDFSSKPPSGRLQATAERILARRSGSLPPIDSSKH